MELTLRIDPHILQQLLLQSLANPQQSLQPLSFNFQQPSLQPLQSSPQSSQQPNTQKEEDVFEDDGKKRNLYDYLKNKTYNDVEKCIKEEENGDYKILRIFRINREGPNFDKNDKNPDRINLCMKVDFKNDKERSRFDHLQWDNKVNLSKQRGKVYRAFSG